MSKGREQIALVLQGGGALGAYQAGAYAALERAGQSPDWFAGISIGAVNAAIMAGNPVERRVERLREFWALISSGGLRQPPIGDDRMTRTFFSEASAALTAAFGAPGFFTPRYAEPFFGALKTAGVSYYDTEPLRETLEKLVDFDRINSGSTRLSVGAVNVTSGNFEYFDSSLTRIDVRHIMASGALPPGFPPIEIDGQLYWDGGLVSNTPLQYILDLGGPRKDMCVFQVDLFSARGLAPLTFAEIAQREKDIRYSSRTRLNTDVFREWQTMRRIIKKLSEHAPEAFRDDPDWLQLEKFTCDAAITIVQLVHRRAAYETQYKDFEFSRMTMEENWADGETDVVETLSHPNFVNRTRPAEGVAVLDLTKDLYPKPAAAETTR